MACGYRERAGVDLSDIYVWRMLDELDQPHVHIKDRERVERIIHNMAEGGKEKLQVIVDFDRTLTKFRHNGELVNTCYNALDDSPRLPDTYREKANATRDHYYAIEVDPALSLEEKTPYMIEWWTKAHHLLLTECNMTKDTIRNISREANILLRDGTEWMFKELHQCDVPLLIFSAGLGDVIEEVVKVRTTLLPNIKVVSNYMDFDKEDKLIGFKGELIHVFNKNESAIHDSQYFTQIKDRENIILMGDSLGDLKMAHGANHKNIIRIGFLNDKIDKLLPKYMDSYDIVLVSDETMNVSISLLKHILK